MYDKNHSKGFGFGCEIIYHIDKINTQIRCSYGTRDDYNYHQEDEKVIKFKNVLESDAFIKKLSKYDIDKILIEEASLEDLFLHYYL
jgi:hypothetical protein